MNRLSLTRVESAQAAYLSEFEDRTIFQSPDWIRFVSDTQNAEPVFAVVKEGNRPVGRFSGLIVKKYGVRILGSPFPGWTTSYMGFNLDSSVSRAEALPALERFAFDDLKCLHLEVMDRRLTSRDFDRQNFRYRLGMGFEIDLTRDEQTLLAAMAPACRRCVRKAAKVGVTIEKATEMSFADDYYAQLEDVFAKQNLVPTYSIERVKSLIEHLLPTGHLLLVRALSGDGDCIATGIFPALNDTMYFWGGASWRRHQILRPNESIQWFAMRYWKARGIAKYDMGGGGEYKRKYGGSEIAVPWGRKSRFPMIEGLRDIARRAFLIRQRCSGRSRQ